MSISDDFLHYVLDQLEGVPGLRFKKMFGGAGLYSGELIFAVIGGDQLFFRADKQNLGAFLERGMGPFSPNLKKPEMKMPYYEVPPEILEQPPLLRVWASAAVDATVRMAALKRKKEAVKKPNSLVKKMVTPKAKPAPKAKAAAAKPAAKAAAKPAAKAAPKKAAAAKPAAKAAPKKAAAAKPAAKAAPKKAAAAKPAVKAAPKKAAAAKPAAKAAPKAAAAKAAPKAAAPKAGAKAPKK